MRGLMGEADKAKRRSTRDEPWRERLRASLMGAVSLAVMASVITSAQAQEVDQTGETGEDLDFDQLFEEVDAIITGSRVQAQSLTAPIPVTTLDEQFLDLTGDKDLSDILLNVPATTASVTSSGTADFVTVFRESGLNDTRFGPQGQSSVGIGAPDLRGLGTSRTLVLVDGERYVGARAGDTAVDVNALPSSLIERVDVLTGGASAIYGADAVSGVVNIITKKNFEGFQVELDGQINDGGDGERFFGAVTAGSSFADGRGHAQINIDYERQEALRCGEQDFCADAARFAAVPDPSAVFQSGPNIGQPRPGVTQRTLFAPRAGFSTGFNGRTGFDFNGDGFPDASAPDAFFIDVDGNGQNDVGQVAALDGTGLGSLSVGADGNLRLHEIGLTSGFGSFFQVGGDFSENAPTNTDTIVPEKEDLIFSASATYQIHDLVDWFVDGRYASTEAQSSLAFQFFVGSVNISQENPFIPAEIRGALNDAAAIDPSIAEINLSHQKDFRDLGMGFSVDRETFRIVTGFEGEFDNGIAYKISYNFGHFDEENTEINQVVSDRFLAAVDAVEGPNGKPICRSEADPATVGDFEGSLDEAGDFFGLSFTEGPVTFTPGDGSCAPANLFGEGNISQESLEFFTVDAVGVVENQQEVVTLELTGDSSAVGFELPAGPIGFATGFQYRSESSEYQPDLFNRAGLRFDSTDFVTVEPLEGSFDVYEFFGETQIPVVRDQPFAEEIAVTGAFRFADYSTVGSTLAWQGNVTWAPVEDFALRGGYSQSIRAPNVGELFAPATTTGVTIPDPCNANEIATAPNPQVREANCRAAGVPEGFADPNAGFRTLETSGNPDLDEEQADTFTIGSVITPRFAPDLSITVDYWNIELTDAIEAQSGNFILSQCYDDPDGIENNQFCEAAPRNDNNVILFLFAETDNIGIIETSGVDFDVRYDLVLGDFFDTDLGELTFRGFGTWTNELVIDGNREIGELRKPEWVVNANLGWSFRDLFVKYNVVYYSEMTRGEPEIENLDAFVNPLNDSLFLHDIAAEYQVFEDWKIYGGVSNLADEAPVQPTTSYPTNPLGRRFFLGVETRF